MNTATITSIGPSMEIVFSRDRAGRLHDRGPVSFDVQLTRDEMHAVKCWIDLNCPLWPDYTPRQQQPGPQATAKRD